MPVRTEVDTVTTIAGAGRICERYRGLEKGASERFAA